MFEGTLRDLGRISLSAPDLNVTGQEQPPAASARSVRPDLIVWPESPAPFYSTDPMLRDTVSNIARQAQTWMLVGSLGIRNAGETPERATELFNSGSLVDPAGEWVGRYNKMHLVPLASMCHSSVWFGFAGGLTKEVGDFLARDVAGGATGRQQARRLHLL